MKRCKAVLVGFGLVGVFLVHGCSPEFGTHKVDRVKFLRLYIGQAPAGQSEMGWCAHYDGRKDGRHYMDVQFSNFGAGPLMFFTGPFKEERYSCLCQDLPDSFPEDLSEVIDRRNASQSWALGRRNLNDIIHEYLKDAGKLTEDARSQLRRASPSAGRAVSKSPDKNPDKPKPSPAGGPDRRGH